MEAGEAGERRRKQTREKRQQCLKKRGKRSSATWRKRDREKNEEVEGLTETLHKEQDRARSGREGRKGGEIKAEEGKAGGGTEETWTEERAGRGEKI